MAQDESAEPTAREAREAAADRAAIEVRPRFQKSDSEQPKDTVFKLEGLTVLYSGVPAVRDIGMEILKNDITALIGPSGCGKSTLIRCLNRMNDLVPSAEVRGKLLYHGEDLYGPTVDPVQVRKLIGMVFQKPNPFPKSIYDNIAFGPRVLGLKATWTRSSSGRYAGGRSGMKSRTGSATTPSACPADSSSGSA